MRSVERTVEEVLLPSLEHGRRARGPRGRARARLPLGHRLAARRAPRRRRAASRPQGVLLFDSSPRLDLEALHVQALELGLRRAGFRTLLLAFDLAPERVVRAMRALDPTAFVFCGGEATLDVVGRLVYTVRQVGSAAPVFEYREVDAGHRRPRHPVARRRAERGRRPPQGLRRQRPHRAGRGRARAGRGARRPASSSQRAAAPRPRASAQTLRQARASAASSSAAERGGHPVRVRREEPLDRAPRPSRVRSITRMSAAPRASWSPLPRRRRVSSVAVTSAAFALAGAEACAGASRHARATRRRW